MGGRVCLKSWVSSSESSLMVSKYLETSSSSRTPEPRAEVVLEDFNIWVSLAMPELSISTESFLRFVAREKRL